MTQPQPQLTQRQTLHVVTRSPNALPMFRIDMKVGSTPWVELVLVPIDDLGFDPSTAELGDEIHLGETQIGIPGIPQTPIVSFRGVRIH